ncbi:uncharacterized protein Dwil_GK25178 [Drosophila willistoni]|uniref:DDE Tnp4 domain-containing protein n=1 Tax=Drosophila willistoni TaxID=7260 RepID=B4N405_DROWI|nr:uncharacterized protein LOC6645459 [Drosophila willistoni]EDW79360.1 uncharacterized protein Dwil_GK25178 [Drosophila willistoni]
MEEEINLATADLSDVLEKLQTSKTSGDLKSRQVEVAHLIELHIQRIKRTVIMVRPRSQQRTRKRFRMLRTFFMRQLIEMQSKYMQMYAMLRLKQFQLQTASQCTNEKSTEKVQQATKECSTSEAVDQIAVNVPRQRQFFEHLMPNFSDNEFLSKLHVTRSTFQTLCRQLSSTLRSAEDLQPPPIVTANKCVALALYFLASGERISLIAEQFALPRARAIKCLKIFCNAVMSGLGKALRRLPQMKVDCDNVAAGFQRESNMPAALMGVLGVCSIPIRASGYLLMEFLLDDRMLFRELQLGNGNRAATCSPLVPSFAVIPNALTSLPKRQINERRVPSFVLAPGDQNYPMRPWLLQRYPEPEAPHEHDFNEVADHLYELSDSALHRFMSRWHFLSQPLDISFQTASCIIQAAAVLHNLLEELSEPHLPEWGSKVKVSQFRATHPMQKPPSDGDEDDSELVERALDVRDFLARTISSTEI